MKPDKDQLFSFIRNGQQLTVKEQVSLTAKLSVPAIMTQISFILVQYIDASMVGHLGAEASAAVGLMSTSTWLLGGLCECMVAGFSVLVAHKIGACRNGDAKNVLRQAFTVCLSWGILLSFFGMMVSDYLPKWLNGGDEIAQMASNYFFIFAAGIPFFQLDYLSASMLRSSGNIKVPSILNVIMCVLDVFFNFLLIYPERHFSVSGIDLVIPGADLGVPGAALGSVLAFVTTSGIMTWYLVCRSKELKIKGENGSFRPEKETLQRALKISVPIGCERLIMCLGAIIVTAIIAPLGNVSIAADTFAITIEGLCYMPGYGIADAASTLVGQCVGAGRKLLAKSFAKITVIVSMSILTVMAVIMFVCAPFMFSLMTDNQEIVELGTVILRIEAFAEPFFGAAIVCYSVFVGAGNSLLPNFINLGSMWLIRIPLVMFVAQSYGLTGVWAAMCFELIIRGTVFLFVLRSPKWLDTQAVREAERAKATSAL
ncbi:MAG: MATE family efflux transporter [Bacteroidales bacterium]|nr:MATE family efflux transporter [Bacteroidales bacterium]